MMTSTNPHVVITYVVDSVEYELTTDAETVEVNQVNDFDSSSSKIEVNITTNCYNQKIVSIDCKDKSVDWITNKLRALGVKDGVLKEDCKIWI